MSLVICSECYQLVSEKAAACPHCGAKTRKSYFKGILIILGLFFLLGIIGSSNSDRTSGSASESVSPHDEALQKATLDYNWSKGGFGSIMLADITIHNNSRYPIKDIKIKCEDTAKSGTSIDTNEETIYDIVAPQSTKKFPEVNMGFIHSQAVSSSCKIADLTVL